jgi:hypothetical protein
MYRCLEKMHMAHLVDTRFPSRSACSRQASCRLQDPFGLRARLLVTNVSQPWQRWCTDERAGMDGYLRESGDQVGNGAGMFTSGA